MVELQITAMYPSFCFIIKALDISSIYGMSFFRQDRYSLSLDITISFFFFNLFFSLSLFLYINGDLDTVSLPGTGAF